MFWFVFNYVLTMQAYILKTYIWLAWSSNFAKCFTYNRKTCAVRIKGIGFDVCCPSVSQLCTGWTVRGSNTGGGRDYSHTSRTALGPTQPPGLCVPGLSRGEKRLGRVADHPPSSWPESRKDRAIPLSTLWVCSGL
jgi:hypothetical protein